MRLLAQMLDAVVDWRCRLALCLFCVRVQPMQWLAG